MEYGISIILAINRFHAIAAYAFLAVSMLQSYNSQFQWPLDKVTNYTKYVLKYEKKHHSNSEGIPFVGLNARQGEALAYKSPEQLEAVLQTILAASGRILLVCNGHDMIKPGFYEVYRKYCGKVGSRP